MKEQSKFSQKTAQKYGANVLNMSDRVIADGAGDVLNIGDVIIAKAKYDAVINDEVNLRTSIIPMIEFIIEGTDVRFPMSALQFNFKTYNYPIVEDGASEVRERVTYKTILDKDADKAVGITLLGTKASDVADAIEDVRILVKAKEVYRVKQGSDKPEEKTYFGFIFAEDEK